MSKTANLYIRIEPELKEQAEGVLSALGIPTSLAVTMFFKQIVLQQGLPLELKLPSKHPLDISQMSDEELDAELEKGYAASLAGEGRPADEVFEQLRSELGI